MYTTIKLFYVSTFFFDSKTFIKSISKKLLLIKESWEKKYQSFPQTIKQHNCFHNENNKKCFFLKQISKLEWSLKDHVTPKTGVMTAKNSALPWQGKNFFYNNLYIGHTLF